MNNSDQPAFDKIEIPEDAIFRCRRGNKFYFKRPFSKLIFMVLDNYHAEYIPELRIIKMTLKQLSQPVKE